MDLTFNIYIIQDSNQMNLAVLGSAYVLRCIGYAPRPGALRRATVHTNAPNHRSHRSEKYPNSVSSSTTPDGDATDVAHRQDIALKETRDVTRRRYIFR